MDYLDIEKILKALSSQLKRIGKRIEIIVCGGSALSIIGLVKRVTKDIDVLAIVEKTNGHFKIVRADFPVWLKKAIEKVARDFDLPPNWMNPGPTSMVDLGLPEGLENRLIEKNYGNNLTVYYISRFDQIHFKLYASVDRGGYHIDDLLKLNPTDEEIEAAARWSMTHDVSEGYRMVLKDLLKRLGYDVVAERI
ncbi:DUF6036 family nucleotidyltransferase [Kosmotoga olearia]|uniref:DUF6036 domain-containing protein n=1 Tax=Kosmotoga olearia (strain ATCC BAA-1733 / DSM 21960 / TBF 19.5.1) TaxID=521045 RepID=C5CF74_KOSOT|nr:DUF6036 family nucleotidyltransferase [Kosmotoga olearia]ACR79351.1 hypothetical protein Kole_0634 [Kosmotoga olearia TBF 19.5.1]